MHADILSALTSTDESTARLIKQAYSTDDIARAVIADPMKHAEQYQIIEGLIYWLRRDGGKSLYIPETAEMKNVDGKKMKMRDLLCYECHDAPIAGHIGIARMSSLLRRSFYWSNMKESIVRQVRECHECQTNKASH